jgi:hypothetical protein
VSRADGTFQRRARRKRREAGWRAAGERGRRGSQALGPGGDGVGPRKKGKRKRKRKKERKKRKKEKEKGEIKIGKRGK